MLQQIEGAREFLHEEIARGRSVNLATTLPHSRSGRQPAGWSGRGRSSIGAELLKKFSGSGGLAPSCTGPRFGERCMKRCPLSVIKLIAGLDDRKIDFRPFREGGRLIDDEAAVDHFRPERLHAYHF